MLQSNSLYYVEPTRSASVSSGNPRTMLTFGGVADLGNYVVTFNDDQTNTATIEEHDNHVADVTLSGRTLYKDGDWNTICLPFDVAIDDSPLKGATIMELDANGDHQGYKTGYDSENGKLYLYFKTAKEVKAGVPYLVKWENIEETENIELEDPVFTNVTITDNTSTTVTASNNGLNTVQFVGNYDPVTLDAGDKTKLYLGSNNQLYWPSTDVTFNAFRAHFSVDLGSDANGVRAFHLGFGDDNATGIIATDYTDYTDKADAWFDLGGRRLNGKPTAKGVYIYNGKKRVVK